MNITYSSVQELKLDLLGNRLGCLESGNASYLSMKHFLLLLVNS